MKPIVPNADDLPFLTPEEQGEDWNRSFIDPS